MRPTPRSATRAAISGSIAKLGNAVETYLADLARVRTSGGGTGERAFSDDERAAMGDALPALGQTTVDIWLNGEVFCRNVPAAVWSYRLGGY